MSIHTAHPSPSNFVINEVETLKYLRTWRLVKDFPDLDTAIQYSLPNYKDIKKLEKTAFEFHAEFPIEIQGHNHNMFIESRISQSDKGNFNEATYLLAITGKDDPAELIRKFHFDHAHPSISTNQRVPIFHLQYGGKLSPKMEKRGLIGKKIDPWLSVPRLIYPPINLAILLDMAFTEFSTEQTAKIIEKSEWRNLIWKNEKFILRGYYTGISDHCNSASYSAKKLIRDFCYGQ